MRLTKFETNYIAKISKMHKKNLLYIKVMFYFRSTFENIQRTHHPSSLDKTLFRKVGPSKWDAIFFPRDLYQNNKLYGNDW